MIYWTKERPKVPGFYFARFASEREQPFVVEARVVKHTSGPTDLWQGPFLLADLGLREVIEFAGPITLPEEAPNCYECKQCRTLQEASYGLWRFQSRISSEGLRAFARAAIHRAEEIERRTAVDLKGGSNALR